MNNKTEQPDFLKHTQNLMSELGLGDDDGWISIYFEVACFLAIYYERNHPKLIEWVANRGFHNLKWIAQEITNEIYPKIQQEYQHLGYSIDILVNYYFDEFLEKS